MNFCSELNFVRRCVLSNDNGEEEFAFKFYVTVEGGMDFRAMLMKRKVKQKKIVVKKIEWLEVRCATCKNLELPIIEENIFNLKV